MHECNVEAFRVLFKLHNVTLLRWNRSYSNRVEGA